MPYVANGKNAMLDALGALAAYASLHTDIPDANGSNEETGGSPAYARKAVTFAGAASGSMALNGTLPTFDVPASTVSFIGFWSALTNGTFYGYAPFNGGATRNAATAQASGDTISTYSHGLSNTNRVILKAVAGGSLPTGLSATTLYFVVGATTDTFQVSLTSGGAAVDITANGELAWIKVVPEVFASQGTATVSSGTLDLND